MNETSAEMEFVSYRHKGSSSYFVNKVRLMEPFLWIRLAAFNYAKSNAFLSMLIDFYKFCIKLRSILFHSIFAPPNSKKSKLVLFVISLADKRAGVYSIIFVFDDRIWRFPDQPLSMISYLYF